jgi:hypothetical protein
MYRTRDNIAPTNISPVIKFLIKILIFCSLNIAVILYSYDVENLTGHKICTLTSTIRFIVYNPILIIIVNI